MKKRFCKRFFAGVAATAMVITAAPLFTQAADEQQEYPAELMFPMSILDFRADNLLFEYALGTNSSLALADLNIDGMTGGTGLVEAELGADGKPVYKREVVEKIAEYVNQALGKSDADTPDTNNMVLDYPGSGVEENPLSIRNYIQGETYTGRIELDALSSTTVSELEAGNVTWKPAGDMGCTVEKEGENLYLVKASDGTLLYRFNGDGIEVKSDRTVEYTYTGLQGNYTISNLWLGSDKVELIANGRSVKASDVVSPDSNGELHLAIRAKAGTDFSSATDAELKVAVLKLAPVE